MASRPDQLSAEIEVTRRELADSLGDLKTEAAQAGRKAAMVAGAVMALWVVYRITRAVLRHRSS